MKPVWTLQIPSGAVSTDSHAFTKFHKACNGKEKSSGLGECFDYV